MPRPLSALEVEEAIEILRKSKLGVPSEKEVERLAELAHKLERNTRNIKRKVRGQRLADLIAPNPDDYPIDYDEQDRRAAAEERIENHRREQ